MSYYKDIYNDFPLRCARLWKKMRRHAEDENLDVTFMLMTAAAGFASPFEHLKIQSGQAKDNKGHPAFQNFDEDSYKKVLQAIETAIDVAVPKSYLFVKSHLDDWFYCKTEKIETIRDQVEGQIRLSQSIEDLKARELIKLLRNAFAHNNIYAFNRKPSTEIDELAFFSEIRKYNKETKKSEVTGYEVLAMPSSDLGHFLDAWFKLLSEADIKGKVLKLAVSEALEGNIDRIAA